MCGGIGASTSVSGKLFPKQFEESCTKWETSPIPEKDVCMRSDYVPSLFRFASGRSSDSYFHSERLPALAYAKAVAFRLFGRTIVHTAAGSVADSHGIPFSPVHDEPTPNVRAKIPLSFQAKKHSIFIFLENLHPHTLIVNKEKGLHPDTKSGYSPILRAVHHSTSAD